MSRIAEKDVAMFPIDFRFPNYKIKAEQVIRDSAVELAVPDAAIVSVIVAGDSDQDYGASIRKCRGHVGSSTHSGGGAGKTVPFRNGDGVIQSEIVYPSSTLTNLFCYSHEAPTYLLSRYAIHHEFGHVIDFHSRSALFPSCLLGHERTVQDYAPYYGAILLSEFAACFISGATVSRNLYEQIAMNARGSIEDVVEQGVQSGNQLPWYILSQEVQVAGTAMGMMGGQQPPLVHWKGASKESISEINHLCDELQKLKDKYPAWDTAACIKQLTERCESFARTLRS